MRSTWEYLEVMIEGVHWRDGNGRQGQLPAVGGGPVQEAGAKADRWGRVGGDSTVVSATGVGAGRRWESLGPLLNELGREGWELAGVLTTALEQRLSSAEFRLLFKRQLS